MVIRVKTEEIFPTGIMTETEVMTEINLYIAHIYVHPQEMEMADGMMTDEIEEILGGEIEETEGHQATLRVHRHRLQREAEEEPIHQTTIVRTELLLEI